ncbi:PH domain-containing protein [Salisediminibacterium selenitireducens]|uniref:Membrane-flanked domain protein n=1 Tax=Bacillus selenitireducens (strain ATCC 700615 / DSM 15326 / MLS10) TaxID=439292 RepID=D6XUU9_BACIE|nr:PH domain-containing protein [Salisediminibacterium selenitireducens]ADH99585.1 membrane-flanked domain protein [[Bacillus] selenitireducens MLS10]
MMNDHRNQSERRDLDDLADDREQGQFDPEKPHTQDSFDQTDQFEDTETDSNETSEDQPAEPEEPSVPVTELYDPAPSFEAGEKRSLPNLPLAEKTLSAWRIGAVIEAVFLFLFPLGYWGVSQFTALPEWGLYVLILVTFVWGLFHIIIWQSLIWSRWKYQVYEDEVELMFGVIVKRRIIIPMIRVQHVDTRQGPVLRYFGLASVTISTAATVHEIPGLTMDNADRLRDQIAELAREADPDE